MERMLTNLIVVCVTLALAAGAMAASSIEIRLKDNSVWRGELNDVVEVTILEYGVEATYRGRLKDVGRLHLVMEAEITGRLQDKTIFQSDIITMRTLGDQSEEAEKIGELQRRTPARDEPGAKAADAGNDDVPRHPDGRPLGVILLPLEGMVGTSFRHEELVKVGEKADEFGPGQIIVLRIKSDGGSSLESQSIAEVIEDLKTRHRVVAWLEKAISAGCQTAMCCDEIYFMTEATAGAVTTWNPGTGQSIKGEELERAMEHLAQIAEKSGYSKHVAHAMKTNSAVCSYTKDPETGVVTWYGDKSGEKLLSDENSNLAFNASDALDCGFSKGTADTPEELAELLDLPKWHELTDYGRKIAASWQRTVKRAEEEIPRLFSQLSYKNTAGGAQERIGTVISIYNKLMRWWDRCPNVCRMNGLPPKEYFEREIEILRRQLAEMNRR